MKQREVATKPQQAIATKSRLTEKDLLWNFEQWRKFIEDMETPYKTLPSFGEAGKEESAEPQYTSEATFSYEVHATR
jgi:hypothetical protein